MLAHIHEFLQWLDNKQIRSIDQLTNRHITNYQNYLETCLNKLFKEHLLSDSHQNKSFIAVDKLLEFLPPYGMTNTPILINRRMEMNEKSGYSK